MKTLRWIVALLGLLQVTFASAKLVEAPASVERWRVCEIVLEGPADGNPFTEVRLTGHFANGHEAKAVDGFYDGDGVYRIRFMPESDGRWSFYTRSNRQELTNAQGVFAVTPASPGNHGPVRVAHTYHFAHADGTPFKPIGTTSYSWTNRPQWIQEETLATLARAPFNKLRMAVWPQAHGADHLPPELFPYEGEPHQWDFSRFNPAFFQHLETRIAQLGELGIQCDLILFHPYGEGRWGIARLPAPEDELYLRYLVARLAAYQNIWWSIGNEYDFLRTKTMEDWDRYFQVVADADPYGHLRSIHNGFLLYDNNKPWVTHASIQNGAAVEDVRSAQLYRDVWNKPVVYDEVKYEGDHWRRWAHLSGEELVHRFWAGTVAGTYVGHSEYFEAEHDIVWLGQGGTLKGESPPRIGFLRQILEDGPAEGLDPIDKWQDFRTAGQPGEYYLVYFGREALDEWAFELPRRGLHDGMRFSVEVIDPWLMTISPVEGAFTVHRIDPYRFGEVNGRTVSLPRKPGMALRLRRLGESTSAETDFDPLEL